MEVTGFPLLLEYLHCPEINSTEIKLRSGRWSSGAVRQKSRSSVTPGDSPEPWGAIGKRGGTHQPQVISLLALCPYCGWMWLTGSGQSTTAWRLLDLGYAFAATLKWVFERSFKERPSRARGSCRSVPCRLHHLASPAGASVTITPSSQLLPAFLAPKLTLIQPGHPAALCCPLLSPSGTDSSGPMLWTRIQGHPKSVLSPLTSACSCELLAVLPTLSSGFTDNYLSWLLSWHSVPSRISSSSVLIMSIFKETVQGHLLLFSYIQSWGKPLPYRFSNSSLNGSCRFPLQDLCYGFSPPCIVHSLSFHKLYL